jgi:hypothetical protein
MRASHIQSYERLQDALIFLKLISQSEEELQRGKWLSQAQVEERLRDMLVD